MGVGFLIDIIKSTLYNNKSQLIYILEELKCHKINPHYKNELRCALPDGNTNTSVQIILNEFLPTYVYSRGEYDKYEIKDIISFVQYILKCNFKSAIQWLCNKLNIEYDEEKIIIREQSETIKCINQYKKNETIEINNPIIDESFLEQFPKYIVKEWIEEGISADIQKKYDIRIDTKDNRWLIPVRDENNNLITIKGRTYLPNWKELGIPKYKHYKNHNKKITNNILFGLNFNYQHIKKENEVILFEGEKSVMKAESMGFLNTVSIGTNHINKYLLPKILSLQCDVVIAFDKDVLLKDIVKQCKKLSKFTNIYYIYDKDGLLNNKDSPVDEGFPIFLDLYNNKKRIL